MERACFSAISALKKIADDLWRLVLPLYASRHHIIIGGVRMPKSLSSLMRSKICVRSISLNSSVDRTGHNRRAGRAGVSARPG